MDRFDDFLMETSAEEFYDAYIDDEIFNSGKRSCRKIVAVDTADRYDMVREGYED